MAKLVVMLRVKDSMFFVQEWLQCFEKIADEIVVLDNGSTDGTCEALAAHPLVVDIVMTHGYNEGRDKNLLYERVRLRKPDWCMWVDIDEIFEPGLNRSDFDSLMGSRAVTRYTFRRFHFIDRTHFAGSWFRLNYTAGHDRMMWREQPTGYFENLVLDSPNVKGISGIKLGTNFRLKHLGYINKELVDKKAAIYKSLISKEKEGNIQTMYMKGERRIKWRDHRHHPEVVLLNGLLNCLLLRQYFFKAVAKLRNLLPAAQTETQISR